MIAVRTEELRGKTVLVTGASSGIGMAAATGLAKMGAEVIMVARDMVRGNLALQEVKTRTGSKDVRLVLADLSSMRETVRLAESLSRQLNKLDLLVNNAAIVPSQREETAEGLELQFAVNHLAYFALSETLLPLLQKSPAAQIINVSSGAHRLGKLDLQDLQWTNRPYSAFSVYSTTKQMNVLYTRELAKRVASTGIRVNAVHPGVIATNIYRAIPTPFRQLMLLFMKRPERGAETILFLASNSAATTSSGLYFDNRKAVEPDPVACKDNLGISLTEASREILENILK